WHSRIFIICERCGALGPFLRADFWVSRDQGVRPAWLCDARRPAPGTAAVRERRIAADPIAARRRGRIAHRVRDPGARTGRVGIVAADQRNRRGRKKEVGAGRLEPVLQRPGPALDRSSDAGGLGCVLSSAERQICQEAFAVAVCGTPTNSGRSGRDLGFFVDRRRILAFAFAWSRGAAGSRFAAWFSIRGGPRGWWRGPPVWRRLLARRWRRWRRVGGVLRCDRWGGSQNRLCLGRGPARPSGDGWFRLLSSRVPVPRSCAS